MAGDPKQGLIGEANFQLSVDAGQFHQALNEAENDAKRASSGIAEALGKSGDAGRAMLQLGYAADDLQYGLRGIVNNIPQLTMALGAGAGLTGTISVLMVGINQLVQHWDSLKDVWVDNSIGQETARMAALADQTERASRAAEALKSRQEALGLTTKEEQTGGGEFKEALATYRPERLRAELIKKSLVGRKVLTEEERDKIEKEIFEAAGGQIGEDVLHRQATAAAKNRGFITEEMMKQIEENVDVMIGRGMKGKVPLSQFGEQFEKEALKAKQKRDETTDKAATAEAEAVQKEKEAERKRGYENTRKFEKDVEQSIKKHTAERKKQFEDDKRARIEDLQDQAEAVQRQQRKLREKLQDEKLPAQFSDIAEATHSINANIHGPKLQLQETRKSNKILEQIRDAIKKEQRARFG